MGDHFKKTSDAGAEEISGTGAEVERAQRPAPAHFSSPASHDAGAAAGVKPLAAAKRAEDSADPAMPALPQDPDGVVRVKRKRRKSHKGVFIALGVVLGIFAVCGIALGLWLHSLDKTIGMTDEEKQELRDALAPEATEEDNSPFYILILGSDAREGDTTSRSDVIMLARVDPKNHVVTLVSIPRDTAVTIDGSTQKINAAYALGGASEAVTCVSEFAGVEISHVVEVHFSELEEVVDTLGGIWVNVPESFSAGNGGMDFEAGEQKLTGEQALAFARERYHVSGGDFGRAQAQRLIVEAIIKQVVGSAPAEIPGLISQLATAVTTDYSLADMGSLAMEFYGTNMTIYSAACPSYSYTSGGVSYVGTEFAEWKSMMQRVDAGLDPNDEDAEIPEEQQSNEKLGAATNSAAPEDYEDIAANAMTTDDVATVE